MALFADLLFLIGYGIYWIFGGFVDIWKGKKETEWLYNPAMSLLLLANF